MSGTGKWFSVVLVTSIAVIVQCAGRERKDLPRASIIVGSVEVVRNGATVPLTKEQYLKPGDTVRVNENAKLKLELQGDGIWYLGNGSELILGEPVVLSATMRRLPATLSRGQMHIVKRAEALEEYSITTSQWIIRVTAADVTIGAGTENASCCVKLLNGFATFMSPGGSEAIIPACSKLVATASGPGELQPITSEDVSQLKSWVGTSVVEEAITISGCTVGVDTSTAPPNADTIEANLPAENRPPEWKVLPEEAVVFNDNVMETVVATDPEQQMVKYFLIKGIKGMTLHAQTGLLKYRATPVGTHQIKIAAGDPAGNRCTTSVVLTIAKGVNVKLYVPKTVSPGELFTVSAKVSGDVQGSTNEYRFDINDDGTFEIPGKNAFGKLAIVKKQQFPGEGVFKVRAEAKTSSGKIVTASRKIVVNTPPTVVFNVKPQSALEGTPVLFDLSSSTDTRNGTTPLQIRLDFNNDGVFEIPEDKPSIDNMTYSHTFDRAGTFTVSAQVTDMDGATSTASVEVTISGKIAGGVLTGPDTVSVNRSCTFTCAGIGLEYVVTGYAWDFGGKGSYQKESSAASGTTTFKQSGTVTVSCRVTDDKKQQLVVSKKVVVVNASTEISAGGPYKIAVNSALTLAGTARDADNAIVSYAWDTDGDGTINWTSQKEGSLSHTYTKAGVYKAIFTITSDDGKKTSDTTEVRVSNKAPTASAGEDIVSRRNRKIELNGSGTDADGSIVLYEWDFNGDGTFDWSSGETGSVSHAFESYSKAVLRVKDSDGEMGTDTVTIIICPEGMRTVDAGSFCIDMYEYPNKHNSAPRIDVTYEEAKKMCAQNGKRLCTVSEWEMACNGNRAKNMYPYGRTYDVDKCNTLGNPRLKNAIAPAGDFIECKSDEEVFDMSGNVAEWTLQSAGNHFVYGGSYQNGEKESSCSSRVKLQAGKKYFYAGFRCCK